MDDPADIVVQLAGDLREYVVEMRVGLLLSHDLPYGVRFEDGVAIVERDVGHQTHKRQNYHHEVELWRLQYFNHNAVDLRLEEIGDAVGGPDQSDHIVDQQTHYG